MKKALFFLSLISWPMAGQAKTKLVCQQITLAKTSYDINIDLEEDTEQPGEEVGKASFTILGREKASISCVSGKKDTNRNNITCKGVWKVSSSTAYLHTWVQIPPTSDQGVVVASLSIRSEGTDGEATSSSMTFLCGKP